MGREPSGRESVGAEQAGAATRHYFCTYFDRNYLTRAMALHESLLQYCPGAHLFALCMDDESFTRLSQLSLPGITLVPLAELEARDLQLLPAKSDRSQLEFYWTCGPVLISWLLSELSNGDLLWYLDADTYFFSSASPMLEEMRGHSVGLVEHRFSKKHLGRKKFGLYNVGVIAFRRDDEGLRAAQWWRSRCLEWCFDKVEATRYGDQKYLDDWPSRFCRVRVLQHKGINLAPWNVDNYILTEQQGQIVVDEQPLIFFHFHGLRELRPWLYDLNLARSGARLSRVLRRSVCGRYIRALRSHSAEGFANRTLRKHDSHASRITALAKGGARFALRLSPRSYLIIFRGRIL